jgi:hypothetical protein
LLLYALFLEIAKAIQHPVRRQRLKTQRPKYASKLWKYGKKMYFSYLGKNIQQTLEELLKFVNISDAANKCVLFYNGTQFGKAKISSAPPPGLGWVHAKGENKLLQNGTPRETSNVLLKLGNIRDIERNRVLFHDGTTFMAYPLTPSALAPCQSGGSQAVRRGNDEADKAEDENDS